MKVTKKIVEEIILEALNGKTCQEISKSLLVKDYVVRYTLKVNKIKLKRDRKYKIHENYFEEINNAEKAYLVGFYTSYNGRLS